MKTLGTRKRERRAAAAAAAEQANVASSSVPANQMCKLKFFPKSLVKTYLYRCFYRSTIQTDSI